MRLLFDNSSPISPEMMPQVCLNYRERGERVIIVETWAGRRLAVPEQRIRVGVSNIPGNWQLVPLYEIAQVRTGIAKGKHYKNKTVRVPYLRVANVQDGYIDLSEIKEIEVLPSEIERYRLQHEDVLMTEGGDFDKLGRGDVWRSQIPLCLHQNHVFAVRANRHVLDPYFLAYLTASPYGRSFFLAASKQSTNLASINSTQLKNFPVPLPPLAEQRRIAEVLGTWDEAIRLVGELIAALKKRKQALMQRLLTGELRFPGFTGEWETVRLGDVANVTMGQSPSSANYNSRGEGLPLIQGNADIQNGKSFPHVFTTEVTKLCDIGDILLSVRAPVGEVAISVHKAVIGRGMAAIRALKADQGFLHQVLLWRHSDWGRIAQGSTFLAINGHDIRDFAVLLPSTLEQDKISGLLKTQDMEIYLLSEQRTQLQRQKHGLMQQLLTGAVRLAGK